MKFVNPKNDVAFRKIFGSENKKEILISFLNNILCFAGTDKEIIDITIQNPYQIPKLEGLKETILDIKAVDKRDVHYIVEMQVFHTAAFEKRVQYYVSKAYSQQLDEGENYPKLNQVIFLGFLDFVLFKETRDYATRHLILEENSNGHHFKDFEFNFVELPKFTAALDQLKDVKEKWIYFVKHAGDMTMIPKELKAPSELQEAFKAANRLSWSREELDAYDAKGILIQDERGRVEYALEEGIKKGKIEGKIEGLKEGNEKGRYEEKIEMARKMKSKGTDIAFISEITGLSKKEIEKI